VLPVAVPPPLIVEPAPYQVSFGRISGRVGPGTRRVVVTVAGQRVGEKELRSRRFTIQVALPRRDVAIRVTALDSEGRRGSTVVTPVFGLPASGAPNFLPPLPGREDRVLARTVGALARGFPGTCGVFVQDLRTGAGAAWNARAQFPGASTLKLAIAVEVLRDLRGTPAPGTRVDVLLRRMLIVSDGEAANELLVRIGGSTSGGSARVNAMLRALAISETDMYGGYEKEKRSLATRGVRARPIPLRVHAEPSFVGKRTTAWDLARLARHVHLAAGARGALVWRFRGAFTPADARYLLYLLARVREPGRLGRFLTGAAAVLHKAGWISKARHDNGLVYWPGGAFVVTVLTWRPAGAGAVSDVLAGRVARAALKHFGRG
jgi:beta-lactamase class A